MRLKDSDGSLMIYRANEQGAIITKGRRALYLIFKSVNQGKKARSLITNNSFNKLFTKGRKIMLLGRNNSYIKVK